MIKKECENCMSMLPKIILTIQNGMLGNNLVSNCYVYKNNFDI